MANNPYKTEKDVKPAAAFPHTPIFAKHNLMWMGIGAAVIALGMLLMAGGKSTDPHVFNANEVYSKMRITVAPLIILIGLGIEVFAIFKK